MLKKKRRDKEEDSVKEEENKGSDPDFRVHVDRHRRRKEKSED